MPSLSRITARFTTQILSQVLAKALGLLMLAAIAAPYAHAVQEITEHETCGMESCKRAGKCCCRRSAPGKPHWDAKDTCHHGCSQQPAVVTSLATLVAPLPSATLLHITTAPRHAISIPSASTDLRTTQFQRPPPKLS